MYTYVHILMICPDANSYKILNDTTQWEKQLPSGPQHKQYFLSLQALPVCARPLKIRSMWCRSKTILIQFLPVSFHTGSSGCYTIALLYYTTNATATAVASNITLDSDTIHRPPPVLGQGSKKVLSLGSYIYRSLVEGLYTLQKHYRSSIYLKLPTCSFL